MLIDGPLATNPFFGSLLASWLPTQRVLLSAGDGGNTKAACYLGGFTDAPSQSLKAVDPLTNKYLHAYREAWRRQVLR